MGWGIATSPKSPLSVPEWTCCFFQTPLALPTSLQMCTHVLVQLCMKAWASIEEHSSVFGTKVWRAGACLSSAQRHGMPSRALWAVEPKPQNKPGKPFPVWRQWDQAGHLLSKHRQSQARGLRLEGCEGAGATRWRCDYRDPQSCVYFGWVICLSAGYFNLILLVFVIPDYLCFPELLACMSLRKLAGAGLRGIGWADIEGKGWGNGQGPWCNACLVKL